MRHRKIVGVLINSRTVQLAEEVDLPEGTQVEVILANGSDNQQASTASTESEVSPEELPLGSLVRVEAVLKQIHTELDKAGFVPPTREEVDERIRTERKSWAVRDMPSEE